MSREPAPRRSPIPPRLLVRAALAARRRLLALADLVVPAQLPVVEHAMGLERTELLRVAARLRLADRLSAGPRTADELAEQAGADEDLLYRALRALAAFGVFRLRPDGRFENNRLSRALRSDADASMQPLVEYLGSPPHVAAWADLERTVRTGESAFERVHGEPVWTWLARHPDEERVFAEAMATLTEVDAPAVARAYPFDEVERVCDVGGGRGALLAEILARHPRLRGVLFDAPHVLARAPALLADRGVAGRVECVAGSFFDAVPAGCDAYLLKDVLHDWDDAAALRILRRCRRAAPPGARVLVAEALLEPLEAISPAALVDVQMAVVCQRGRQRSVAEHRALLSGAGFRAGRVVALAGPASLVEGLA